jgi:hypothetical protein
MQHFSAIYDWISALPPPSCWVKVDISYDCPGVTPYEPFYKHSNGEILISKFVISKSVVKGFYAFNLKCHYTIRKVNIFSFPVGWAGCLLVIGRKTRCPTF